MLKNKTYKKKLQVMLGGSALFLLLCYFVSINKTVSMIVESNKMEDLLNSVADAPNKINKIKARLLQIENSVIKSDNENNNFQENLLEKVSKYCQVNKIILREFPQAHKYNQQNYNIETYTIAVEGPFVKLLKLVFALETTNAGKMISVKFESKLDYKTNTNRLTATIFIQNIKNTINEKL